MMCTLISTTGSTEAKRKNINTNKEVTASLLQQKIAMMSSTRCCDFSADGGIQGGFQQRAT